MNYEEKYKDALERARKELQACGSQDCDAARQVFRLFPELKESEDERIRKAIIEFFELQDDNTTYSFVPKKDILTWLEKQGETFTKKDVDDAYLKGISDAKNEFEKKGEKPQGKTALEAIKEEKVNNANKIESKFKVGDWVVQENIGTYKVVEVCESWYEVIDVEDNHYSIAFDKEYMCHLWSIEDAKVGDVLMFEDEVFILKNYTLWNKVVYHCCYDQKNFFVHDIYALTKDDFSKIHPATKEQRDLLFAKMKEAGYEWNTEKKEVRKIEDENYDGEDYGIDSLFHAQRILEKTLGKVDGYQTDDGILEHKCAIEAVNKLYKQKPAWSEEDESCINDLLEFFGKGNCLAHEVNDIIYWLKSLKERMK